MVADRRWSHNASLDKGDILMSTWYIDQLEANAVFAQISYEDYGIYIPAIYGGYSDTSIRLGNAATSELFYNFITKFPIDSWFDTACKQYITDEFYYKDNNCYVKVISSDTYKDYNYRIGTADYNDNDYLIKTLATSIKDASFWIKSDYDCAETEFYIPIGDEFYYADGNFRLITPADYDADYAEVNFRLGIRNDAAADYGYYIRFTGSDRYITRIRFKELKEFGSIHYRLEYMPPNQQVWSMFEVVNAKVNTFNVPIWSPILQNPCYANIYRSEEIIDIYVNPVWCTEVRMMIYSTEDPFNRIGTIEFGIFEDLQRIDVDAFRVGMISEHVDSTSEYDWYGSVIVGWSTEYTGKYDVHDSTAIDDIKIGWVPNIVQDGTAVDSVKIQFYSKYHYKDAVMRICVDKPYIDHNFYIQYPGYEDYNYYIDCLGADIESGNFFIPIPDYLDYNTVIGYILGTSIEDYNLNICVDKPYVEADMFIPTPEYLDYNTFINTCYEGFIDSTSYIGLVAVSYEDHEMYLDTMPTAMEVADFIIEVDKPYIDADIYINSLATSIEDSTSYIGIADIVFADAFSGSFNIGIPTKTVTSGSFNISLGTTTKTNSGSFNVAGAVKVHILTCRILTDYDVMKMNALGIELELMEDEITEVVDCHGI